MPGVQLEEIYAEIINRYTTEKGLVKQRTIDGYDIRRKNFYGRALLRTKTIDESMVPSLKVGRLTLQLFDLSVNTWNICQGS